jgi:hypothetical protein
MKNRKETQAAFLTALALDPSVTAACDAAGISRDTAYRWRSQSATFEKLWDEALIHTQDRARSSIYRRGIVGWEEPLVSAGQPVYESEPVTDLEGKPMLDKRGRPIVKQGKMIMVRKHSDSLAALYAKANLPEYKDKPQVNINTQVADLAEQAKRELLADLEAAIHEDSKAAQ